MRKQRKCLRNGWIDEELAGCEFSDVRLNKRFRKLLEQLSGGIGESIPWACQDWANTKAAYRFLSNGQVSEAGILKGHFQATRDRLRSSDGPILMLHDTTEFNYHRDDMAAIGILHKNPVRRKRDGTPQHTIVCGLLMHSSLAVTTDGIPLGLSAIKFWSRDQFYGCNALKKKINPTRVPIEVKESFRWLENLRQSTALFDEPRRCIHIGDEMKEVPIQGLHRIQVRDDRGQIGEAVLEIRYRRIRVLPPIGKQKQYPDLNLTVIHAQERGKPRGRNRIDWKLITDLPVTSRRDALEKIHWYSQRWKIETFHKILKSGCRAEASKLRTAERLVNFLSILCILGWRIFWLTMINRAMPNASPELAFTSLELRLLDQLVNDKKGGKPRTKPLSAYLIKLARLGGYLARTHDPPPGNMVLWRGVSRLTDIQLEFLLGAQLVGN